ncbi:hypothetical protein LCGC14_1529940 [marine sediment metagenome]|uniref:Uncharacterized protein n=2 Tax=root TaxID=1 RepID=A0A831VQE9_9FLAO|nr:hypothetical protein [Pricia antarctica]
MATFVLGGSTITFTGFIFPFVHTYEHHQNIGVAEDGSVKAYDRSVTERFIGIKLNEKNHTNATTNLRTFIITTVTFTKDTFTFTPDSGMNVGNGDGGAVTVRWWGGSLVESQWAYQKYAYDIILRVEI